MVDLTLLAETVAIFLAPALPYLLGLGGKAAEEAAKEAGKSGVKKLWEKLRPKVEAKVAAKEAADELAAEPESSETRLVFRRQIEKLLAADAELASEVEKILRRAGVSFEAVQSGSGGLGQGWNPIVAGQRGLASRTIRDSVVFSGEFHAPVHAGAHSTPGPSTGHEALRRAYLSRLFRELRQLALGGVDPAVVEDPQARLDLAPVYTSLTTYPEADMAADRKEVPRGLRAVEIDERRRIPALEQLDRHRHLVLLGDPGSGKSTFVQFVGLCMAGELLGDPEVNLSLLNSSSSDGEGENPHSGREEKEKRPPWRQGPLLPVRVILRDFAAHGLPRKGEEAGASHLWGFIERALTRSSLGDYAQPLHEELRKRGGLILLDGLDEVPEAEDRRVQLRRVVQDFARSFQECRLLVTCRVYAYQNQSWRLDDFTEATLASFSEHQIRRFIGQWYSAVAARTGWEETKTRGRATRLERAVFGRKSLRSLAERPLLLTLMASLHAWRAGDLPQKRERLYYEAVELLLSTWERQRVVYGADGEPVLQQPSLTEWLKVEPEEIRKVLNELAYDAHEKQSEPEGAADIAEDSLLKALKSLAPDGGVNPVLLERHLRDRTGLLQARGVGVYAFPHPTFQEYLAACHLTDTGFPTKVAELARKSPGRWREVLLLAGAKAASGGDFAVWQLARELSYRDLDAQNSGIEDTWGALLAGQLLAESAALNRASDACKQQLVELTHRLVGVLGSELPAIERAEAGRVLGLLGDSREEVTTLDGMEFCRVPKGRFRMGGEVWKDEKPVHEVDLPYDYWLGRFPVTVAQFRAYVEESGVVPRNPNCLDGGANEPVVLVTWYEALELCRWLTTKWRGAGVLPDGWAVTLPSEAEWEKAARGGLEIPVETGDEPSARAVSEIEPSLEPPMRENPQLAREYPWEGQYDPERANTGKTEFGKVSAVGCFPRGRSLYGCEEMAGNVWEWTRSLWGKDPTEPDFGYPYDPVDERREGIAASREVLRVLRGGSFVGDHRVARCAARGRNFPYGRGRFIGFRVLLC